MKKARIVFGIVLCASLAAVIIGGGSFYARRETAYRARKIEPMATYRLSAFTEIEARESLMLCAHRGLSAAAPENTIEAIRAAGEAGFSFVALDVTLTKDGEAVLLADDTIERMTAGCGRVSSYTRDALQRYPLDNGANVTDYDRVQIPTLRQALEVCGEYKMQAILSVRTGRQAPSDEVLQLFRQAAMLCSTQKPILESLQEIGVPLCYRTDAMQPHDLQYAALHGFALAFDPEATSETLVRNASVPLWAWVADTRRTVEKAAENGVRNIVTDCILPMPKK